MGRGKVLGEGCLDSDTNFHLARQSAAFPLFPFYETTTENNLSLRK